MGDEDVAQRREWDARYNELARHAVAAIDDIGLAACDDHLRRCRAGAARPRPAAGAEQDQPRSRWLRGRCRREQGRRRRGCASQEGASIRVWVHGRGTSRAANCVFCRRFVPAASRAEISIGRRQRRVWQSRGSQGRPSCPRGRRLCAEQNDLTSSRFGSLWKALHSDPYA